MLLLAIPCVCATHTTHSLQQLSGGGALGHPRVYISLEKPGAHSCGYCGLRFEAGLLLFCCCFVFVFVFVVFVFVVFDFVVFDFDFDFDFFLIFFVFVFVYFDFFF